MDRETANQLADELIDAEKRASSDTPRRDSPRTRGNVGIGHFVIPIVISCVITWVALAASASGVLAILLGALSGLAASHLIIKHVIDPQ